MVKDVDEHDEPEPLHERARRLRPELERAERRAVAARELADPDGPEKLNALYQRLRSQVEHENNLYNQRVVWLITMQAFLFATVGLLFNSRVAHPQSMSWERDGFTGLICFSGIFVSLTAWQILSDARGVLDYLRDFWSDCTMSLDLRLTYPYPHTSGGGGQGTRRKILRSGNLPIFFALNWVVAAGILLGGYLADPVRPTLAVWVLWSISWAAAAVWSGQTVTRPRGWLGWAYFLPTLLGVWLLLIPELAPRHVLAQRILAQAVLVHRYWRFQPAAGCMPWAATVASFAFAWWARLHLGTLWSGTITRKEGHRVVDTGPYRLVRHPIYTGIIAAGFILAAELATLAAFAGAALMTLGWWMKAREEERFLSRELGPAYDDYRRRTPMLLPRIGPRGRPDRPHPDQAMAATSNGG
jgi:protein-S-isoprenylcysteine O-methyltransferase Ste14